jgi:PAS domain S-box-containing protein
LRGNLTIVSSKEPRELKMKRAQLAIGAGVVIVLSVATKYLSHQPYWIDYSKQIRHFLVGELGYANLFILFYAATGIFVWYLASQQTTKQNLKTLNDQRAAHRDIHFKALIESSSDAIVLIDAKRKILYQSHSGEVICGYTLAELQALDFLQLIHPEEREEEKELFQKVVASSGVHLQRTHRFKTKNGNYVWLEGAFTNRLMDKNVNAIVHNYHDVTERVEAQQRVIIANRMYQVISKINQVMVHATDEVTLFTEACKIAVDLGKIKMAWVGLIDDTQRKVIPVVHVGEEKGYLSKMKSIELDNDLSKKGPTGKALSTGVFAFCQDIENDTSMQPWLDGAVDCGFRSTIAIPIKKFGKVIGAFNLYSAMPQLFDANDFANLHETTEDISFVLENFEKERMRKIGEEQLIAEKTFSDSIVVSLPGLFYLFNREGRFIRWNKNLEHVTGYSSEEIRHMQPEQFFIPAEAELVLDKIDDVFTLGHAEIVLSLQTKSKEEHTYQFKGQKVNINNTDYLIGTGIDISARVQAEKELSLQHEEVKKLSLVASKTDDLVVITDAAENIEWVNDSFTRLTGFSLSEVLGKKPSDFLQGPETDKQSLERMRKEIDDGRPVVEEVLNYSKDGKKYWLRVSINPVFNEHGKVAKFIAVETNITKQKEFEMHITSLARDLAELIENANAIIFGIDREGYINEWNKLSVETTGYTKEQVLGKKLSEFIISPEREAELNLIIESALAGSIINQQEFEIIDRASERHNLLLSATPRRNASDEIVGVIAVAQNITELTEYRHLLEEKVKERTKELNFSLEKEKELGGLKIRFASMVSHEFRTPLSTILIAIGYIRRYKSRMTPESIDLKIETVEHQVNIMVNLMEDVLTMGKVDSEKIRIRKSTINLSAFFGSIKEQVQNSYKNTHSIECTMSFEHKEIESDEDLLRNIMVNLLGNAIKFSPEKRTIFLKATELHNHLMVEVRDEGRGIPEADSERIFLPFDRGSLVNSIPGTGLGLAIVKRAVDLFGGEIKIKSEFGEGTTFTVTIPLA